MDTEKVTSALRSEFAPKVILVNHSRKFDVDAKCANLSIKFNMLYLSVYQLIRSHIQNQTSVGKALLKARKPKNMRAKEAWEQDPHCEREFSAVHFDLEVVIRMLQATITEKRTDQQYILLEGLCNNTFLEDEADKLSLRAMDEFFAIERNLGEVAAVISLQHELESTQFIDDKWEEFAEPSV